MGECALVERLESKFAKYGAKETGSNDKDSWKHI